MDEVMDAAGCLIIAHHASVVTVQHSSFDFDLDQVDLVKLLVPALAMQPSSISSVPMYQDRLDSCSTHCHGCLQSAYVKTSL
jgi:hypothetical protein